MDWTTTDCKITFTRVRFPPRLLLVGCLCSLVCDTRAESSPTGASMLWTQVENAPNHLGWMRALTSFALSAPIKEFPAAIEAVERWPKNDDSSPFHIIWRSRREPPPPNPRVERARYILAHAFTTRATDVAIAYSYTLGTDAVLRFQPGFFTALTLINPARALVELLKLAPEARHTAALTIVTVLAPKDPARACNLLLEMKTSDIEVINVVLKYLIQHDAPRTLAVIAQLPENLRNPAGIELSYTWFPLAPEAAGAWIKMNVPIEERPLLFRRIFSRLESTGGFEKLYAFEADPDPIIRAAAAEIIKIQITQQPFPTIWNRIRTKGWEGIPLAKSSNDVFAVSLGTLLAYANSRPSDEIAAVLKSFPHSLGTQKYHCVEMASLFALHDPEGALAWAEKIPDSTTRDEALVGLTSALFESDPELALARIDTVPVGSFRTKLIKSTANAYARKDIDGALTWARGFPPGPDQTQALRELSEVGSSHDPATLATTIARLSFDPTAANITQALAQYWVYGDPPAALDWFAGLPAGPLRQKIQEHVVNIATRDAPEEVIALAQTLPNGPERSAFICELAEKKITTHPGAIIALIDSLPPSSARGFARVLALRTLITDNPAATVALVDSGAFGPLTPGTIQTVAQEWSEQSPSESARWLALHLKGQDNDDRLVSDGVATVARNYAQQEPEAALVWAANLADPIASKNAVLAASGSMAPTHPERAWSAALSTHPDFRELRYVFNRIRSKHPETALRLLSSSSLSEDVKTQLQAVATSR